MPSSSLMKLAALLASTLPAVASTTFAQEKGTVVLPYAAYKGELGGSGSFYNYTNVRYADPPTKDNRFRAPIAPSDYTSKGVMTATSDGHNCMQMLQGEFPVPNQDEDCLFLDVLVPVEASSDKPLPVVVYLYGDEFGQGYKGLYPGDGLLKASGNKVVYVVPNVRTGIFGFLSGSAVEKDGALNAGLLDQDFALRWVQQYIHLFGGSPTSVTVLGSDSGAASLLHHITAKDGKGDLPFQKAVLQSPAYVPLIQADGEGLYTEILAFTQTSDLAGHRALPTSVLLGMSQQIDRTIKWRPVIDGTFVTDLPTRLLDQGKFHDIPLLISRARDEGQHLMPRTFPFIPIDTDASHDSPALFSDFLLRQGIFLSPEAEKQAAIFYPPLGKVDPNFYNTIFGRYTTMLTEVAFACYGRALNEAKKGKAYNLFFNVGQGFHNDDNGYYFAGSAVARQAPLVQVSNKTISGYMQGYLSNFATTGNPNQGPVADLPVVGEYGSGKQVLNLADVTSAYGSKAVVHIKDPLASEQYAIDRCNFWSDKAWQ